MTGAAGQKRKKDDRYDGRETAFAAASLRLLALGLRPDGLPELCAPARVPVTIPAFSLCFVIALRECRRYATDRTEKGNDG